ncbi:MAG: hypothetical protein ACOYNY_10145 [Caldilineaceae bacterium]|jgi:hypothetical protein
MQTIKQWSHALLIFVRQMVVLFLATIGVVTLLCWYQGWWTLATYGMVLSWAGMLLVCIAGAVSIGSPSVRTSAIDPHWQAARSAAAVSMTEAIQQDQHYSQAAFGFILLLGLTGLIVLAVGYGLTVWPGLG